MQTTLSPAFGVPNSVQFMQHEGVDGRDEPGHDGRGGAREFAPITDKGVSATECV